MGEGILLTIIGIVVLFLMTAKHGQAPAAPAPLTAKDYSMDYLIGKWARVRELRPALVKAVVKQESNFRPNAVGDNGTAIGLMQVRVLPGSWDDVLDEFNQAEGKEYTREDLFDADKNLEVGTWHLAKLVKKYDEETGVSMYNIGETGFLRGRRNDYNTRVIAYARQYARSTGVA